MAPTLCGGGASGRAVAADCIHTLAARSYQGAGTSCSSANGGFPFTDFFFGLSAPEFGKDLPEAEGVCRQMRLGLD